MLQREKAGAKRISAVIERQTLKAVDSNPIGYAIAEPLDISADIKRLFFILNHPVFGDNKFHPAK